MENTLQTMYQLAQDVKQCAYAPYSHFQVGACLLTDSGSFHVGCNVENASYGLTLCAEASALASMVASGKQKISAIVITTDSTQFCPPCGACRQRLMEFATPTMKVHLFNQEGSHQGLSMVDLFPFPFDKTFLHR